MFANLLQKALVAEFELCVAPHLGIAAVSDHQFYTSCPNNPKYQKMSVQKYTKMTNQKLNLDKNLKQPNQSKFPIPIRQCF